MQVGRAETRNVSRKGTLARIERSANASRATDRPMHCFLHASRVTLQLMRGLSRKIREQGVYFSLPGSIQWQEWTAR
jgi:hypothetical protein